MMISVQPVSESQKLFFFQWSRILHSGSPDAGEGGGLAERKVTKHALRMKQLDGMMQLDSVVMVGRRNG